MDSVVKSTIPFAKYDGATSQSSFAMDLSKSPTGVDLSGIALRGGNQLELNYTIAPTGGVASVLDTWVCNKILCVYNNKNVIVNL